MLSTQKSYLELTHRTFLQNKYLLINPSLLQRFSWNNGNRNLTQPKKILPLKNYLKTSNQKETHLLAFQRTLYLVYYLPIYSITRCLFGKMKKFSRAQIKTHTTTTPTSVFKQIKVASNHTFVKFAAKITRHTDSWEATCQKNIRIRKLKSMFRLRLNEECTRKELVQNRRQLKSKKFKVSI